MNMVAPSPVSMVVPLSHEYGCSLTVPSLNQEYGCTPHPWVICTLSHEYECSISVPSVIDMAVPPSMSMAVPISHEYGLYPQCTLAILTIEYGCSIYVPCTLINQNGCIVLQTWVWLFPHSWVWLYLFSHEYRCTLSVPSAMSMSVL